VIAGAETVWKRGCFLEFSAVLNSIPVCFGFLDVREKYEKSARPA